MGYVVMCSGICDGGGVGCGSDVSCYGDVWWVMVYVVVCRCVWCVLVVCGDVRWCLWCLWCLEVVVWWCVVYGGVCCVVVCLVCGWYVMVVCSMWW